MAMKYASNFGGQVTEILSHPGVWGPLAATGAMVVGNVAQDALRRVQASRRRAEAFKSMLDLHPQLKERDPRQVTLIYNSLHNANPMLAHDPMVAGAWVDNVIETNVSLGHGASNQALLSAVKDLAGIRSQIARAKRDEDGPGIGDTLYRTVGGVAAGIGEARREHGDTAKLRTQLDKSREEQKLVREESRQSIRGLEQMSRNEIAQRQREIAHLEGKLRTTTRLMHRDRGLVRDAKQMRKDYDNAMAVIQQGLHAPGGPAAQPIVPPRP